MSIIHVLRFQARTVRVSVDYGWQIRMPPVMEDAPDLGHCDTRRHKGRQSHEQASEVP